MHVAADQCYGDLPQLYRMVATPQAYSPCNSTRPPPRVVTGTLLIPRERTADVYLRYGAKYGVTLTEAEVLERFRR
jgi:hypothetical protein